jgi:hypothetical protein
VWILKIGRNPLRQLKHLWINLDAIYFALDLIMKVFTFTKTGTENTNAVVSLTIFTEIPNIVNAVTKLVRCLENEEFMTSTIQISSNRLSNYSSVRTIVSSR